MPGIAYKPEQYTSVAPYLLVNGAAASVDFLVRVFDADKRGGFQDAGGTTWWIATQLE